MPVDNPGEVDGDRQSHQSDEEPEEPNLIMTGFGGYESDIDMVVDLETEEEEDCEELKGVGSVLLRRFLSLRERAGHPVTVVDLQEEFEEELASHRSGQENMLL